MRISPFARGMIILAVIAAAIVGLNQQTTLLTVTVLVQAVFFIAVAVVVYMLWRDFGRREIAIWPAHQQRVFYGGVALLLVDLGWYFAVRPTGRDLLAFFLVAAACVYAAVRTWINQQRYG